MNRLERGFLLALTAVLLAQCGGSSSNALTPGLTVRFDVQGGARLFEDPSLTSCAVSGATGETDGYCVSPISVSGDVGSIAVGTLGGSYRVLVGPQAGVGLKSDGTLAVTRVSPGGDLTGVAGNFTGVRDGFWNRVVVSFTKLDVKVRLKGKFWNVRFMAAAPNPLYENNIDGCIVDDAYRAKIQAAADAAAQTHIRGDVLYCIRNDSLDCADSEYRWLDSSAAAFASTRPSEGAHQEDPSSRFFPTCTETSPGVYAVNLKGLRFVGALTDGLRLSTGSDGQLTYALASGATGSAGALRLSLKFSLAQLVQLTKVSSPDLSSYSDEAISDALTLAPLQVLVHNSPDSIPAFSVTPELSTTP